MDEVKNFTIRLSPKLLDKLRKIAERERRSLNSQLVIMLEQMAADEDTPQADDKIPTLACASA
jgi:hypothetical protein